MKNLIRKPLFHVLIAIVIVSVSLAIYFYQKSKQVDDNASITQAETKALMRKVGDLVILPEGEVPTIATVSDPEALKDQPFFAGAKKGDKVLIYTNAKKAILFDPLVGKIINIAPLSMGNTSSQTGF